MWLDLTFKYTAIFTAIILHEIAHGYAALLMGDDTAKKEGRLSLNPLKHADLFGTFFIAADAVDCPCGNYVRLGQTGAD